MTKQQKRGVIPLLISTFLGQTFTMCVWRNVKIPLTSFLMDWCQMSLPQEKSIFREPLQRNAFFILMPHHFLHSYALKSFISALCTTLKYQARYIPFFNVRQDTQINVHFIKEYGIVPIAYGCTEI